MRIVRPVVCLAVATSLAGAGLASAATKPKPKPIKPVCNLVTDATGDASPQAPAPSDDTLDIVSADVASNAKLLTVVLRLKDLSASSAVANFGVSYEVNVTVPTATNPVFLMYSSDATGTQAVFGDIETIQGTANNTTKGQATAIVDKAKNEVRLTAKIADLASLGKFTPGVKISGIDAITWAEVGTPEAFPEVDAPGIGPVIGPGNGLLETVDDATGGKNYVAGNPSCVKPGV